MPRLEITRTFPPGGPAALNRSIGVELAVTPSSANTNEVLTNVIKEAGRRGPEWKFNGGALGSSIVNFGNSLAVDLMTAKPGWALYILNPGPSGYWHATSNAIASKCDNNGTIGWTLYHLSNGRIVQKLIAGGGNGVTESTDGVLVSDTPGVLLVTFNGIFNASLNTKFYWNGRDVTNISLAAGATHVTDSGVPLSLGSGVYGAAACSVGALALFAAGRGTLRPEQIAAISGNPWGVFEPDSLHVPDVVAGGDVSLSLTGQSVSVSTGTVAGAVSVAITGQSATVGQGSLSAGVSSAITGQAASLAQGSVVIASNTALTGQAIPVGQGSVSAGVSVALTGQSIVASIGTVAGAVSKQISGQAASVGLGSLAATVSVPLAGQTISIGQGSVAVPGAATAALTGQGVSITQGSVSAGVSIAITGQAVQTSIGQVAAAVSKTLSGQVAQIGQGSVVASVSKPISGQAIVAGLGTVSIFSGGATLVANSRVWKAMRRATAWKPGKRSTRWLPKFRK